MKKWLIITSLGALMVLVVGMILGAALVNKFSKPTYIIQQPQTQTQQPIDYSQR